MRKTCRMLAAFGGVALCGMAWAHESADCDCPRASDAPIQWQTAWYAGASAGQETFGDWSTVRELDDGSYAAESEDNRGAGYRIFAGIDFLRYLGVEAGYADLGSASFAAESDGSGFLWDAGPVREEAELQGADLSLLARAPLPGQFALVGQAGVFRWKSEGTGYGSVQGFGPTGYLHEPEEGTDVLYGGRLEYDGLPAVRLTAAYTRSHFDLVYREDASLEMFALSAAYRF